jgi:hypothetical protein
VGNGTAKDNQVKKGIGAETVGSVDGHTGGFTGGEKTRDDLVVAVLVDGKNLTSVPSWDTTHVVMDGRKDRNRLLRGIREDPA